MAGSTHAAVTPVGIRDGEPAALAALVERRANAVLAFCETVLGPREAERAAAEAFARFRAAVATTEDPRALDPETLLLGATRHAAAALTPAPTPDPGGSGLRRLLPRGRGGTLETCSHIPGLLAARAEGALGDADSERLARHLERHAPCRALAERAARAEKAYAAPPERTVPIGALTEILLALAAAAPVLAVPDDDFDFGIDPDELPPSLPPLDTAGAYGEPEPTDTAPAAAVLPVEAPKDLEGEDGLEAEDELDASEADAPPATVAVVPGDLAVEDHDAPDTDDEGPGGQTEVMPVVAVSGPGGVAHPRPPRQQLGRPAAPPAHGLLYRYLLPGAFVAATLLIVMAIAGVFSSDPAPTGAAPATSSTLPAAPPPGAPPVSSAPSTPRTPSEDAAVRRAATAARKAREAKAAAARKRAAEAAAKRPATSSSPAVTTGRAPPAVVPPAPKTSTGASTAPTTGRAPAEPSAAAEKPAASTAERQPEGSSSGLPGAGSDAPPTEDPGVFEEGATP